MNDLEKNKAETEGQERHIQENTNFARIEPYTHPAGGWGALLSVARNLKRQEVFAKGSITLMNINQPTGFDCPGCAWPEKKILTHLTFVKMVQKLLHSKQPVNELLQNFLRITQ